MRAAVDDWSICCRWVGARSTTAALVQMRLAISLSWQPNQTSSIVGRGGSQLRWRTMLAAMGTGCLPRRPTPAWCQQRAPGQPARPRPTPAHLGDTESAAQRRDRRSGHSPTANACARRPTAAPRQAEQHVLDLNPNVAGLGRPAHERTGDGEGDRPPDRPTPAQCQQPAPDAARAPLTHTGTPWRHQQRRALPPTARTPPPQRRTATRGARPSDTGLIAPRGPRRWAAGARQLWQRGHVSSRTAQRPLGASSERQMQPERPRPTPARPGDIESAAPPTARTVRLISRRSPTTAAADGTAATSKTAAAGWRSATASRQSVRPHPPPRRPATRLAGERGRDQRGGRP